MSNPLHFDEEFWKTRRLLNFLGDGTFGEGPCLSTSWVACAGYWDETAGPPGGYSLIFPTVSDCLLWFRWIALGYFQNNQNLYEPEAQQVQLSGDLAEIAQNIDINLHRRTADQILQESLKRYEQIAVHYSGFVSSGYSIHRYMRERGSLKLWRETISFPDLEYVEKEFRMPDKYWIRVEEVIKTELFECQGSLGTAEEYIEEIEDQE